MNELNGTYGTSNYFSMMLRAVPVVKQMLFDVITQQSLQVLLILTLDDIRE
jgi:hypothetical protein